MRGRLFAPKFLSTNLKQPYWSCLCSGALPVDHVPNLSPKGGTVTVNFCPKNFSWHLLFRGGVSLGNFVHLTSGCSVSLYVWFRAVMECTCFNILIELLLSYGLFSVLFNGIPNNAGRKLTCMVTDLGAGWRQGKLPWILHTSICERSCLQGTFWLPINCVLSSFCIMRIIGRIML